MGNFIAIHKHEYGTSVKLFKSDEDAIAIFNALPESESDHACGEDRPTFTQVDFAERINIDFEPDIGETLVISFIDHESYDTVSFEDFKA